MLQVLVLYFGIMLGLVGPTIPAVFHTDLPEAALENLRLRDGERVDLAVEDGEDGQLRLEIRSRGKSQFITVTRAHADGFERAADSEFGVPVRATLSRSETRESQPTCVAKKVYARSALGWSPSHDECDRRVVKTTLRLDFQGVGSIQTGTALTSK